MTSPRRQIVDPDTPGYFQCVSRCVRRALLCGHDACSGQSFEHRREWVEDRLLELAEIFSVGVYAYAVMSNHLHVVLQADPLRPAQWSDEELAERWVRLFPARMNGHLDEDACAAKREGLLKDPARIAALRERLGSVSWFTRFLNEPIARRANFEDGCTGRFWEGRYKCQALPDEAAIAACIAYVDLNPIRAGMARDLTDSDHTSIKRRLDAMTEDTPDNVLLRPLAGLAPVDAFPITLGDYIDLVDWTGRQIRNDKRGHIANAAPAALNMLGVNQRQWQTQVLGIESRYWRAVGAVDALEKKPRPSVSAG